MPIAAICVPSWVQAQALSGAGSAQRGIVVVPYGSVQETFSDNVALSNTGKRSDFATQGTVGVRVTSGGGRIRGSVDYALTGSAHSSQVGGDQFTNSLNGLVTGELITNHLFVDLTGNISQSTLSAFGTQSVDTTSTNSNRTEVATFGVSPYLRGLITPAVAYEIRANGQWTSARADNAARSSQYSGLAHAGSAQAGVFGWTADASTSTLKSGEGRLSSTSDSYKGTVIFNPNPDLSLSVIGGVDRNNYLTAGTATYGNYGTQARWRPSTRTDFSARLGHDYSGNSHDVTMNYRAARSAWSFVDTRSVTSSRTPTGGLATIFSPAYLRLYDDLAAAIPDPVQRNLAVLQFLAAGGLSPTQTLSNLYLTSQMILQRTQSLTFSVNGIRDTVSLRAYKTTSSGLNNQPIVNTGLTSSTTVHQTGGAIDLSHRLTSVTSVGSTLQYVRNAGDRSDQLTTLKAVYLNLNTRAGPRSNLGGGVRHVIFDSLTAPYTENAVYATYSQSF